MEKRFISLSFGVESTTMAILYGKGATAIWCDTGIEEPELYARVDYVEAKLKEIHDGDFSLLRIKPSVKAKEIEVNTIEGAAILWKYFPSQTSRYCTSKFKIEPIDEFLSTQGDCKLMIGFNANEEPGKDRTGNFMKCTNVTYLYPLHEDGYTREDCEVILNSYGLHPNFPIYMSRGGCKWCFFRSKKEIKAKYIFAPDEFHTDMQFEKYMNAISDRKKFYAINISCGSYEDIMKECDQEIAMWGIDAVKSMYKNILPHKPCGAFCHR